MHQNIRSHKKRNLCSFLESIDRICLSPFNSTSNLPRAQTHSPHHDHSSRLKTPHEETSVSHNQSSESLKDQKDQKDRNSHQSLSMTDKASLNFQQMLITEEKGIIEIADETQSKAIEKLVDLCYGVDPRVVNCNLNEIRDEILRRQRLKRKAISRLETRL